MPTIAQVTDRPLSGLNHIDALLGSGLPWNFIGRDTINFSFTIGPAPAASSGILNPPTITAFNQTQMAQARAILAYITQLTGIQFTETASAAAADLHFANAELLDGYTSQNLTSMSYANQGGQAAGLDVDAWVYLDAFENAFDNQSPLPGGDGYQSLLHELGHALGLKHPFEGAQQLSAGTSLGQDNSLTTVMSNTDVGAQRTSYAPYDLAALAWLYGGDGLGGQYGVGAQGEMLMGGVANDFLQGGAGFDIAVYTGARAGYSIARSGTNFTVVDSSGQGGTDTLAGIEHIRFNNVSVNLTAGAVAASITTAQLDSLIELYIGYLNRVPDSDGMVYWINNFKAGMSLDQIGQLFYSAAVFFGDLTGYRADSTTAEFVDRIYNNVLGRPEPDTEGFAYWSNKLDSGEETRGSMVAAILHDAHSFKGDVQWGWVADLLDNKIMVGKLAAIDKGQVYNTPAESIVSGMAILAAITPDSTDAAISLVGVHDALDLLA